MNLLFGNKTLSARLLSCAALLITSDLEADNYNISITASGFSPAYVEVSVGDTVSWWNQDSNPHSTRNDAYPWSLGPIAPGYGVYLHTQKPGAFVYFDDWGLPSAMLVIKAPVLSQPMLLPDGYFEFTMSNLVAGETLNIQASTDLVHWTTILTRPALQATDSFIDPASGPPKFYRISVVP